MNGEAYKPFAVSMMKSEQTIHMRPEDQCTRNHVKGDAEQIRLAIMAALYQKPSDEEQVLKMLQMRDQFGVQCRARHIQIAQVVRMIP